MSTRTQLSPKVLEQAADWFTRFRSTEVSDSEREAFFRWIRQSPKHVQAYLAEVLAYFDVVSDRTCDRLVNRIEEPCSDTWTRRPRSGTRH